MNRNHKEWACTHRLILTALILTCIPCRMSAQDFKNMVSPAFFGPNTFQVPLMNDNARTTDKLQAVLAGDFIHGHTGQRDYTADICFEFHVPLFSDRVNISAWGVLQEWYVQSNDVLAYRGIPAGSGYDRGNKTGAIFISTDVQVCRERKSCPAILLRACLRTASENDSYPARRGYDAAGYFFDLSLGKTFGQASISASAGFLCWQTAVGLQNDAILFGVKANYAHEYFRAGVQYGGYCGWHHDGDFPRVLYLHSDFGPRNWPVKPYILYQHGFNDWPFDLFRAGIKVDVSLPYGSARHHMTE